MLAILLLLVLLIGFFSIPAVQTSLAKRLTDDINQKYGTDIHIGRVGLKWNLDVSLKEIFIKDHHKDTLFFVGKLNTSLLSAKNAADGKLEFGDIDIDALTFKLKTYKDEKDTSLDVFVAKLEQYDTIPKTEPSSFFLSTGDIDIENSRFLLVDENKTSSDVLVFTDLSIEGQDLVVEGPNVSLKVNELSFLDDRNLRVKSLATSFTYTLSQMRFDDLLIKTPLSKVAGEIVFNYERKDFQDFFDKVKVSAEFSEATISFDEVNLFYNEFGSFITADFSTKLEGVLNDFTANDFKLASSSTRIDGNIQFKNLFDSKRGFELDGDFERLSSNYFQLQSLLPNILGRSLPSSFQRFGQFNIAGYTNITEKAIDADVVIETNIGVLVSDLVLSKINNIDNALYSGTIIAENLDLGVLLEDDEFGIASFDLVVDGQGFTKENLNTEVRGRVFKLGYKNYSYKNLSVSGILKDQLFDGRLVSRDQNAKLTFEGLADFSGEKNDFNFKASIDHADLRRLNFVQRDSISVFRGDLAMNMVGTNLDDLDGEIRFEKTYYKNQNQEYFFKDFEVVSSFNDSIRTITINSSDIVTGSLEGKFKMMELGYLAQNAIGSIYANYSPYVVTEGQFVDFNFNIKNKIIDVFFPEVSLGPNTFIRGNIAANDSEFKLNFKSPSIDFFENVFDDVNIQIDNKNPLFNTIVEVADINTRYYNANDFNLVNVTLNDTLFFKTEFNGGEENRDNYDLSFYHTIDTNQRSVVGVKRSRLNFKGNEWLINAENNKQNKVIFSKRLDTIDIDKMVLTYEDEKIDIEGKLIDSTYKDVKLRFTDVDLKKITPRIDSLKLDGTVNGSLNVFQKNRSYLTTSSLDIANLAVNEFVLGDLDVKVAGNEDLTDYTVDASLVRGDIRSLFAKGDIQVRESGNFIDVDTELKELDLRPFDPLGEGVIANMRGFVSGKAKVLGALENPSINGQLQLEQAGIAIPYLNVDFDFANTAKVQLYDQTFHFDKVNIVDTAFKTKGILDGDIRHSRFSDWELDLMLNTNRLLVLNTKEDEDELYYGTAFMDGKAHIYGPTDRLIIDVEALTEKGTSIKIPISDVVTIGDSSFIRFVDKSDANGNGSQQMALEEFKGLTLNFDLDVTPDAEVEIVLDKRSGSTLRGKGAGSLRMEIDTNGKFNMWGDLITYEGIYNFKYGGLFDKRFVVLPEGTIIWEGDPLQAQVNIEAAYTVPNGANPAILLDNPNFNRKIPTEVRIRLEGELMRPDDPKFDIRFPNASGVVVSELEYRLANEEREQLQAISLLSQGVFMNDVSISQQALANNFLETASGLFDSLFNQGDSKVNIGVNYAPGDRSGVNGIETDDRLGLTVTTQITDRILVNGRIGVPVGGITETAVIGDVQVDLLLNEDGTLRAKVFNRENDFQYVTDELGYTQGVGLSYQVDFDNFKELLGKIFKRSKKKMEERERKKKEQDAKSSEDDRPTLPGLSFKSEKKKKN
ncbi:translocation/assembly module TamB domain-containing protein [Sungkyunkwania multivorans]|uniref:Translocation/assembly module TamB domain-containing protein n=1 Tax=Sungkyunkwania multivorans TaxID=1173618 RepID=A0ABW3CZ36_9FLAO